MDLGLLPAACLPGVSSRPGRPGDRGGRCRNAALDPRLGLGVGPAEPFPGEQDEPVDEQEYRRGSGLGE